MYYTCNGVYTNCEVTMKGNKFLNNTSEKSGGAIKWAEKEPLGIQDSSNTYERNYAKVYGNDFASYPQRITKKKAGRLLQEGDYLSEQKSGSVIDSFFLLSDRQVWVGCS